ncbi:hypothetical protein AAG570_003600 [Ranatra chinensis]|uniref:Acyltransferase C-terminal domain-containing protein n=1 Tax=Ranatra chinensis TaxID=642074 RepID=A0ABD0Y468_9HEMI
MGDDLDLCSSGRTLVLANHQSTADVPLLMSCFNARKGIVPHVMWIMSRRFKYTNFGLVSILRGDFFVLSVLSEPRGIEWVLDITVAYPGGEPLDMYSMISGTSSPTTTLLLYRIYPFSDIPRGEADSSAWLIDRWREKEYLLDKFYDTGEMDYQAYCSSPIKPRIIRQSLFRFMLVHAFFLVSTYLQFKLIRLAIYHLLDIPILFWLNTLLTNLPNLIQYR